jgi:hypothetical protein
MGNPKRMKTFKRILLPFTSLLIIISGSYLLTDGIKHHTAWIVMFLPVLMVAIVGVVYLASILINKIPE